MKYNIDLNRLPLCEYREILRNQNLLPGRRMLHEKMDEAFDLIEREGIANIAQLIKQLQSSPRFSKLQKSTGLSEEYLTLLKRELGSLSQKPILLSLFSEIDDKLIDLLKSKGINDSKAFYESDIENEELRSLCDLVRINGIGALAARMFYEAGFGSVYSIAETDCDDMLARITDVNDRKKYYKGNLGQKDMKFCKDFAMVLIRYS